MLRIIRSNSIEALAGALAERLNAELPADPLQAQQVLVSTNAMGRWLALALSEHLGICAGIDFDFGGRYLRQLVRQLAQQPSEASDPWEPEVLRWRLASLLDQLPASGPYGPLQRLWQRRGSPAGHLDRYRLQLLLQLADTLDQYGLYRPGPLRRWLENPAQGGLELGFNGAPLAEEERWQPALLRELQLLAAAEGFSHPSQRLAASLDQLAKDQELLRSWGQQGPLHVFGLSSLPPAFLQLLAGIAGRGYRQVLLYVLSPCQDPWAQLPLPAADAPEEALEALEDQLLHQGHPLLANLGRTQRDFQWQLEILKADLQEKFEEQLLPSPSVASDGDLLSLLKDDLLHGRCRSSLPGHETPLELQPEQLNLQLIHCHGDLRQVEEAQRAVLELLRQDPSLEPRHVLLMSPDVARFAPLVQAIFERPGGNADPRHLPIRVTDRTLRQRNPQIDLAFRLLALAGSRLERHELLDLLLLPVVASQFQLELLSHHQWLGLLGRCGITWGRDGSHRQSWGYPPGEAHSWQWGLDRLLLGIHLEDRFPEQAAAAGEWQGRAAFVDPLAPAAVVIALIEACGCLFEVLAQLQGFQAPAAWETALARGVHLLCGSGEDDGWQSPELYDLLAPLRSPASQALRLDREAVTRLMEEAEAQEQGRYGHVSGAVTLSALEPMRSIPHRVVVLLGMDDQRLPRRDNPASYDLMALEPWRGDRNRRQEDRAMLLEALQACRDQFIATYNGSDPRTGEARNPAAPLAELLASLERSFRGPGGQPIGPLLVHQAEPLRPIPPGATTPEPLWPPGLRWPSPALAEDPSLEELQRFFRDPARELLRSHGIRPQQRPQEEEDPEEAQPEGLARWQLGELLLTVGSPGLNPENWPASRLALGRRGLLPEAEAGESAGASPWRRSRQLLQLAAQHLELQPKAQLLLGSGRLRPKRLLLAWLAHLWANRTAPQASLLVGPSKEGQKERLRGLPLAPLPVAEAEAHWRQLAAIRREGLAGPIAFEPEPSWQLLLNRQKQATAQGAPLEGLDAKALEGFSGSVSWGGEGPRWSEALLQLHGGEAPAFELWAAQPEAWQRVGEILLPLSFATAQALAADSIGSLDPFDPRLDSPGEAHG
ncbi:MAG: exodeoxyribonuclease V subunit gamma [Synechococcus lacustris]